jgi:methyl-accepting chemotaxis protein
MFDKLNVLNRLKIWQKLAAVGLAFAVPLALTTYFLVEEKSIKIDFARWELYGDEYLRPCARLLADVVHHKTAVRRMLRGDASQKQPMLDLESSIDRELRDLEAVDRRLAQPLQTTPEGLGARQREGAQPTQIRAAWERARASSPDLKASEDLHTKLVASIRLLITHVGDSSKLILDPDLDTYYTMDALLLREPELVDRLGELNDAVDDILLKGKNVTLVDRTFIASSLALLQFHVEGLTGDATTAVNEAPNFSRDPGIERALGAPSAEVANALRALAALTSSDVVEASSPSVSAAQHGAALARGLDAVNRYWAALFDEEDIMLQSRMRGDLQRRSVALWSVVFAFALTVVLTVFILRSITRPIAKAADVAARLARGELPDEVDIGSATDETGALLAAINKMLKYLDLRRTIDTLKELAEMLTTAMTELEAQAVENDRAITRQAAALQETQVTSQEIKQTSRLAAEKAEGVLVIAERAEVTSRSGATAIERSLSGLAEIKTQAEEIAAKIGDLNERTQQIGTITQTVKDLADQSNMLALNAAIEAVRSGEHGKGFGVVAREIRSLADQSIQATNRVNEILDSVASSIRMAVAMVEKGGQRMEAGVLEVRTSGDSLRTLSEIVHESSQSARQIAAAVSQQDAGIGQVFRAISDQSLLMEETLKRVESTRSAIGTVKQATERVAALAGRYRTT